MPDVTFENEEPFIRVRFQPYELDLKSGELWRESSPVRLSPQPAKVLCLLVERSGTLVNREDIQRVLWQDETFVDFDQGLNYCIRQIRVALEDSADQPIFIATIPRRGYRFIAEVGVVVPSTSSPISFSPRPVANTIEQPSPQSQEPAIPTDTRRGLPGIEAKAGWLSRNQVFIGTLAILILAGLVCFGVWRRHLVRAFVVAASASNGDKAFNVSSRTSVAVLGFSNLDGKESDAWLSTALSEMLSTELSEGGKLRLVSAEEVAKARRVVQLPESLSQETLGRLHQELGADVVVLGSYAILTKNHGRKLRLDLRLQDARDGQILAAFAQTNDEAQLFDLVSSAGARLRQKLGVGSLSQVEEASFVHSFPSDPDARRLYAEGLGRLRRFDALGARELLEQVTKIEPSFGPARSALAAAWSALGYDAKATEEAKKATSLTADMPREEQLSIEARYYEIAQDRPKAAEPLRTLVSFFPDNIDYGIRLATVQAQASQISEALSTLAKLRKLPEPLGTNPRLDIMESQVRSDAGDYKQSRDLAEEAARKSRAVDAPFLVAEALRAKAFALERLGFPDASLEASSEMKRIDTEANFPRGVGLALLVNGDVLYDQGNFNAARERFENALSIFQEIGDRKNQGQSLERIGNTFHDQGKFAQSQNAYVRAQEAYREIQWLMGISSATGNLANTLDAFGDLKGSLKMHQEALGIFQQIGSKRAIASEIDNIAFVQEELGDLPAAAEGHLQSITLHRQIGHQRGEMYGLGGLGDVLLLQGNLDASRKRYEAARTLGVKTQEEDHVALFDIELATIDLLQKRLPEAEARVRRSAVQFQKDKDPEGNAQTYALLTQILLAEKKKPEAIEAGKQAEGYAGQVTSLPPQFEVGLALADLEAETGKKELARKRLQSLLERARRGGYQQYMLEARRVLIGLETGKARNNHLAALKDEAQQKGFGLIVAEIAAMPDNRTIEQASTVRSF